LGGNPAAYNHEHQSKYGVYKRIRPSEILHGHNFSSSSTTPSDTRLFKSFLSFQSTQHSRLPTQPPRSPARNPALEIHSRPWTNFSVHKQQLNYIKRSTESNHSNHKDNNRRIVSCEKAGGNHLFSPTNRLHQACWRAATADSTSIE
jgi:hypothetical protein